MSELRKKLGLPPEFDRLPHYIAFKRKPSTREEAATTVYLGAPIIWGYESLNDILNQVSKRENARKKAEAERPLSRWEKHENPAISPR